MSDKTTLNILLSSLQKLPMDQWQRIIPYSGQVTAYEKNESNRTSGCLYSSVPYTFHEYRTERENFEISLIKALTGTALRREDGSIRDGDFRGDPDLYVLTVEESEILVLSAITFNHNYSKLYREEWPDILDDDRIQALYEAVDKKSIAHEDELKQKSKRKLRALFQ